VIAYVQGDVVYTDSESVVVNANGVGWQVFAPANLLNFAKGDQVEFFVSTIVKEDSITLYGFQTTEHRRVFNLIRGVSGVGPKTALSILSTLDLDDLLVAVADNAWQPLTQVSGVGRKTAQRIVLELKEKFQNLTLQRTVPPGRRKPAVFMELRAALQSLGYKEREIARVVDHLQEGRDTEPTMADLTDMLKTAIKELSKN